MPRIPHPAPPPPPPSPGGAAAAEAIAPLFFDVLGLFGAPPSSFVLGAGGGGDDGPSLWSVWHTTAAVPPPPPGPVTTADFPDDAPPARRPARKRPADDGDAECCCICLDPLRAAAAVTLPPCAHRVHTACLCGVEPGAGVGGDAAVRCPLCRAPLDRHALGAMGFAVAPGDLRACEARCGALRHLRDGTGWTAAAPSEAPGRTLARLVGACRRLGMRDGLVYNVCVLGLERACYHRRSLAASLAAELAPGGGAPHRRRRTPTTWCRRPWRRTWTSSSRPAGTSTTAASSKTTPTARGPRRCTPCSWTPTGTWWS